MKTLILICFLFSDYQCWTRRHVYCTIDLTVVANARHGGVVEQVVEARLAEALVTEADALAVTSLAAVDAAAGCANGRHGDETKRLS